MVAHEHECATRIARKNRLLPMGAEGRSEEQCASAGEEGTPHGPLQISWHEAQEQRAQLLQKTRQRRHNEKWQKNARKASANR